MLCGYNSNTHQDFKSNIHVTWLNHNLYNQWKFVLDVIYKTEIELE